MALGVEGQYYFQFGIGDRTDFITEGNLTSFRVQEATGNVLPTFEMLFNTDDETIISHLHEGNQIEVTFGRTITDLITTRLVINRFTKTPAGGGLYKVFLNGLYANLGYISNPSLFISPNRSGVEVMRDIVRQAGFSIGSLDFNVTRSDDRQRWVQHNISDRRFVNNIWLHSLITDSFLCVGITTDGRFVLKDMRRLFASEPRWNFVLPETGLATRDRDILYDPDPVVDSQAGFINSWIGRGRERTIYDLEDGTSEDVLVDVQPLLAVTRRLGRGSTLTKRRGEVAMVNGNVHPAYWEAYMTNLTNLAIFSSMGPIVSFTGPYRDIRILDTVSYEEIEVSRRQIAEHHSGIYIVNTVTRELTARQFGTVVRLCREAPNALVGDLR